MPRRMNTRIAEPVETVKGYWLKEAAVNHSCGHSDCFTCPFKDCFVNGDGSDYAGAEKPKVKGRIYANAEERKAAGRQRWKERYEERKANGICVSCGLEKATPGKIRCERCLKMIRDNQIRREGRKK